MEMNLRVQEKKHSLAKEFKVQIESSKSLTSHLIKAI